MRNSENDPIQEEGGLLRPLDNGTREISDPEERDRYRVQVWGP